MEHERQIVHSLYLTLMSVLFGMLISLWMLSVKEIIGEHGSVAAPIPVEGEHGSVAAPIPVEGYGVRAVLVLITLVCLWWWYAMFLGRVAPGRRFGTYVLDFLTIVSFGAGATFWYHDSWFAGSLVAASVLMGLRLLLARSVVPYGRDRHAINMVLALLLASAVCAGSFVLGAAPTLKGIEWYGLVIMLCGIVVTLGAVWRSEGFTRPKHRLEGAPHPKLAFILATPFPEGVTPDKLEVLKLASSAGRSEFAGMLSSVDSPSWQGIHLSRVHAETDTAVQSMLVCLTSVHNVSEMRAKALMTYFCHWLDDVCDARLIPRHLLRRYGFGTDWPEELPSFLMPDSAKFVDIIKKVRARFKGLGLNEDVFNGGVRRVALGAAMSTSGTRERARRGHHEHLRTVLEDAEIHARLEAAIGPDRSVDYVHLTTKTVHELWMGLEQCCHSPSTIHCVELIIMPAIYYHDYEEERAYGESDGTKLSPEIAAQAIAAVGQVLIEQGQDPRLELRVWQIRSLVASFAGVLPPVVADAYLDVAERLSCLAVENE